MRESQVEAHLVARVEQTGGLVRKIRYIGRSACPDRLVGWPPRKLTFGKYEDGRQIMPNAETEPRHALVETKRPKGKARDDQEREHTRLRAVGLDVRVLDTIEAVDAFIKEMTE